MAIKTAIISGSSWHHWLLAAVVVVSPLVFQAQTEAQTGAPADPAAIARYRAALEDYDRAHQLYAATAGAYWSSITEKRKSRNGKRARNEALSVNDYVLDQPPVYTGPPKPRNPLQPEAQEKRAYVPVVADFLQAAQQEFKFSPRQPQNDGEFKRAYARIAAAAGLTREQAVRIYSFEATGNGNYDVEAGLEYNKHGRAITTALGYNQLLATNSVEVVAESGDQFVSALRVAAEQSPPAQRQALEAKIEILRHMIAFTRTVPDVWGEHEILGGTARGLAVHALNLDVDVGPLLQTQKLIDSVVFARRKGFSGRMTAAELEMMNLTGDGNGFDIVSMPADWRTQVPTTNFFRPSGYADNPVAQRNNVVAKLIAATDARMDEESKKPGAQELAAAFR
ncbi:MAG TPA: hypothetical protein VH206_09135 [Xanthobacteraceae bacterium]|jgi:hypothetical protein|nr:hypothetical protein [Xanthobacteraceae bacterium]